MSDVAISSSQEQIQDNMLLVTNCRSNTSSNAQHGNQDGGQEQSVKYRTRISKQSRAYRKYLLEIQDAQTEKWLEKTGRFPKKRWKISQKRALKQWFQRLDKDGSGEIDVDELADPLLSTGLARSMSEVTNFVQQFDNNGSSGIDFQEFLLVMKKESKQHNNNHRSGMVHEHKTFKCFQTDGAGAPQKEISTTRCRDNSNQVKAGSASSNPIVEFIRRQSSEQMDLKTILSQERRKLLLQATMVQADKRSGAYDQIYNWRSELKALEGPSKFRIMKEISSLLQELDRGKAENDDFVESIKEVLNNLQNDTNGHE